MANFASRLKKLRNKMNLRQQDLAQKLGVSQTTIANYEQDLRFPQQNLLCSIADYFDVSIDYLLGRIDTEQKLQPENKEQISLSPVANKYLDYLLQGNKNKAKELIIAHLETDLNIEQVYQQIFTPCLKKIGALWDQNKLSIAQEHYFTAATKSIISQLDPYLSPTEKTNYSVVATTPTGEFHTIGLQIVTDFLKMDGWETYYLGHNLPTKSILSALEKYNANLLIVSATLKNNLERVNNLIQGVRSTQLQVKILVGGQACNYNSNLRKNIKADGYAKNVTEAIEVANKLVDK